MQATSKCARNTRATPGDCGAYAHPPVSHRPSGNTELGGWRGAGIRSLQAAAPYGYTDSDVAIRERPSGVGNPGPNTLPHPDTRPLQAPPRPPLTPGPGRRPGSLPGRSRSTPRPRTPPYSGLRSGYRRRPSPRRRPAGTPAAACRGPGPRRPPASLPPRPRCCGWEAPGMRCLARPAPALPPAPAPPNA